MVLFYKEYKNGVFSVVYIYWFYVDLIMFFLDIIVFICLVNLFMIVVGVINKVDVNCLVNLNVMFNVGLLDFVCDCVV